MHREVVGKGRWPVVGGSNPAGAVHANAVGRKGTMTAWKPGPPPIMDDGSAVLVVLNQTSAEKARLEYYGDPVAVVRWSSNLKTTLQAIRLSYDDVELWCEIPKL